MSPPRPARRADPVERARPLASASRALARPLVALALIASPLACSTPPLRVPRYGPHVGDEATAVPYPPPPALVTVVPEPPPGDRGEHVWLDGEWRWKSARWAWVPGRWERPPAPAAYWAPAVTARLGDGSLVHFVGRWHLPRS